MDTEYQLADTINESLTSQCARAVRHNTQNNSKNADAILWEWVLDNGECLLTKYLNETTAEIKETLIYIQLEDDKLFEGEFWFDPEVELPTENN